MLFTLGGINLFILSPRLYTAEDSAISNLKKTVKTEIILGGLLLLAVGVLTGVAPAFEALQARSAQGSIESANIDNVTMVLRIAPVEVGNSEFRVEINDRRPGATDVPGQVLMRFTSLSMDMGTQQVETLTEDGKVFSARGTFFSMNGEWQVVVILKRVGFNDIRHSFEFEIH
jgi:hypothetical protein